MFNMYVTTVIYARYCIRRIATNPPPPSALVSPVIMVHPNVGDLIASESGMFGEHKWSAYLFVHVHCLLPCTLKLHKQMHLKIHLKVHKHIEKRMRMHTRRYTHDHTGMEVFCYITHTFTCIHAPNPHRNQ